jgi:hypothetical protein
MKITLCGSAGFVVEMNALAEQLKKSGHDVKSMPLKFTDGNGKVWQTLDYHKFKKSKPFNNPEFLNNHHERIREHFIKSLGQTQFWLPTTTKTELPITLARTR